MKTCYPSAHITDSASYRKGYTTDEARKIFCDRHRYQRWLDVEVALATAQAELNIIPLWAAKSISEKAHLSFLDLEAVCQGVRESSHSLLPLLKGLQNVCEKDAGQFIHFGATTQDIQDTAQALEMSDVINIVKRDLKNIMTLVSDLAVRYAGSVMIGRTHCQHALPMTLGLKLAVWLDELSRDFDRLIACEERVLVAQLFGGVGTMDAFGQQGICLLDSFAEKLGLAAPLTAWHAARDRSAEYLSTMALIGGTLARIADEIRSLARSETGELEEPFVMGKVGSSTMPHKRNPEMCEQVVVLSRLIKANAGLGFDGMVNEHERDYRAVRLEWVTIADTSLYIAGALALTEAILKDLIVHDQKIQRHVHEAAPFICSEALMFLLGKDIGKQTAHQVLYEVSMKAIETGRPLLDTLLERPDILNRFKRKELENAIKPEHHIGLSHELTQRTVKAVKKQLEAVLVDPANEITCPLASVDGCCILT